MLQRIFDPETGRLVLELGHADHRPKRKKSHSAIDGIGSVANIVLKIIKDDGCVVWEIKGKAFLESHAAISTIVFLPEPVPSKKKTSSQSRQPRNSPLDEYAELAKHCNIDILFDL